MFFNSCFKILFHVENQSISVVVVFFQDVRMVDPNFIKIFKLAQLSIEYLLVGTTIMTLNQITCYCILLSLYRFDSHCT